jgi:homoserine O-succinyltransferase
VFDCIKAAEHAVVSGVPTQWRVPHSRYNEISEDALVSRGYRILSRLPAIGPDMFIKQRRSLFIFMQGHPEYDAATLLREYRRDIRRFLSGQRDRYPEMPHGYFDECDGAAFAILRQRALGNRGLDLSSNFPSTAERKLPYSWRRTAVCIYANWLSYLVEQRSRNRGPTKSLSRECVSN